MQNEINEIDVRELDISFIATFSQGVFATLTFSTYLVHTPLLFELIQTHCRLEL